MKLQRTLIAAAVAALAGVWVPTSPRAGGREPSR